MHKISLPALIAIAALTTLVGCASKPAHEAPKEPVAADSAKIRLFGKNGNMVKLYKNSDCIGGGKEVVVSGALSQSFSSMLGAVENESIGMTETENSKNVSELGGWGHAAFYKEIPLNPGEPVVIRMEYGDAGGGHCAYSAFTFVPEKNVEYEGLVKIDEDAKVCHYILNRISDKGELVPLQSRKAISCS